MKPDLPVWRSLMYVPVNVDKYVDKAHTRGADCVQLDLEDSVPAHEKDKARMLVQKAAEKVRRGGADVVVRINRPIEMTVRDLEQCISPLVSGIAVTKADSASHLRILDDLVSRLEEKQGMEVGTTRFLAMVETADAFFRIHEIANAVARTAAINIGGEDFALDINMQPSGEGLFYPKQHMIIAASSAGIMPMGFIDSVAGFGEWDKFRKMVRRSRDFGFMGAGCIHPGQVTIVNEEYKPTADELDYARKMIQLDKETAAAGRASFAMDGKMIDVPVVIRAERLIARYEKIVEREKRTQAAMK